MNILFKILCIILIVMSVLLMIINPILGIIILILAVFGLIKSNKLYRKKEKVLSQQPKDKPENTKTIKVSGITHYMDSVMIFVGENDEYEYTKRQIINEGMEDEEIPEYVFFDHPARFEFEPDNPYDSNAIAIYINELQIGYVPKENIDFIHDIVESGRLKKATCKFVGGNYKKYNSETETIEKTELSIGARITVEYENTKD